MQFKKFEELNAILPPLGVNDYQNLTASIRENGIQNPLFILEDGTVIDGFHRLQIAREIGLKEEEIPVQVKKLEKEQALFLGLSLNLARRHLSVEQKREMIKTLRAKGYTQEQVARVIGITQPRVKQLEEQKEDISNINIYNAYTFDQRYKIKKEQEEEIFERVQLGEAQRQVAADYGISQPRVNQIIKKVSKQKERAEELEKQREGIAKLSPLERVYEVIVIDPPWPYGTEYNSESRRVASPYPEMSIDEIAAIEIPAANNCILWLWTTNAFMHEAFHILESWGFEPKTILTWVKDRMGIGVWLRGKTEHCILSVRGNPRVSLTNQTTVLYGQVREHSRKPEEFYQLVENLCTGWKLDYFGREEREGWDVYGPERNKFMGAEKEEREG